ncbi:hypothetical protein [Actinomadura sp. 6N118]|uniref:hypothetical protein n=1 Tax=Actinomadura sp. 6N118 TaxID=3375151 RepID=UPI0037B6956C
MKGIIRPHHWSARAAVSAATGMSLLVTAMPADAGTGKIVFNYSAPDVADAGDTVTWRWTIKNTGGESAEKVVLTHRLTPKLKIRSVKKPCEVTETSIRCRYGTLKAGQKRQGTLAAELPPDASGNVQINGRVTWHHGPAAEQTPKTGATQPPADAPATNTPPPAGQPNTPPPAGQPNTPPPAGQPNTPAPVAAPQ